MFRSFPDGFQAAKTLSPNSDSTTGDALLSEQKSINLATKVRLYYKLVKFVKEQLHERLYNLDSSMSSRFFSWYRAAVFEDEYLFKILKQAKPMIVAMSYNHCHFKEELWGERLIVREKREVQ